MHSIEDQLIDNQNSDTSLPDNYSNIGMCSTSTMLNISEKIQEILDRNSGQFVFPHIIIGIADTTIDDCYDEEVMQNEIVPYFFPPKTQYHVEIESLETDSHKIL
ncbi:hypothetical protein NPIL_324011 [Nephila pilipes]|uniref:Uncharacterized protein n=1 Tax=Nephila pilipes TaxID=299642 RepID=A0A8X6QJY2_NEPPI|nr:hypothetical protein NPIL_324011 [Nephila pilipes]